MNSLNLKKTVYPANGGAKAAYRHKIARFSGVFSIKRGGLPPRISKSLLFLPLALLVLFNCEAIFDIYPPEIEIIEPDEERSYFYTLPCSLEVADNRDIAEVELFIDDEFINSLTSAPFVDTLDITGYSNGTHKIKVIAYDYGGNWSSDEQSFDIWRPTLIGSITTPDPANRVYVSGSYAYVGIQSGGMQIIDVSDPSNPIRRSTYNAPLSVSDCFIVGNHAYVADPHYGLLVIDVSNKANPRLVGSYSVGIHAVHINGNYAYVLRGGLKIIDISDKSNPAQLGECSTPGSASNLFVSGTYAYVLDWEGGFHVIDISNPANPVLLGSYDTPEYASGVFVTDNYAYVGAAKNGLYIINITNPVIPTLVGIYHSQDYAGGVVIIGNYAYVAAGNRGLEIIDVSDPSDPILASAEDQSFFAFDIFVSGSSVYIAASRSGLQIFDISGMP